MHASTRIILSDQPTKDAMTSYQIGNMSPEKAESVKEKLQGKTYLDFDVTLGVQPGPSRNVVVYTPKNVTERKLKEKIIFTLATA